MTRRARVVTKTDPWMTQDDLNLIPSRLRGKLEKVDQEELAASLRNLWDEVKHDDRIRMTGEILDMSSGAPHGDLDDLPSLLASAARLTMLWHLREILNVVNPATGDHVVDRIELAVDHTTSGLRHVDVISVHVHNKSIPIIVQLPCYELLGDMYYRTFDPVCYKIRDSHGRAPSRSLFPGDVTPVDQIKLNYDSDEDYMRLAVYGKIIVEVMGLESYDVEAIRGYVESQHDWALAAFGEATHDYCMKLGDKTPDRTGREVLKDAIVTLLLRRCKTDDVEMVGHLRLMDDVHGADMYFDDLRFYSAVRGACVFRESEWYDSNDLASDCSGEYPNGMERLSLEMSGPTLMPAGQSVRLRREMNEDGSDSASSDGHGRKVRYHRQYIGMASTNGCLVRQLPMDLRRSVTRERVMELEAKTHFLSASLLEGSSSRPVMDKVSDVLCKNGKIDHWTFSKMMTNGGLSVRQSSLELPFSPPMVDDVDVLWEIANLREVMGFSPTEEELKSVDLIDGGTGGDRRTFDFDERVFDGADGLRFMALDEVWSLRAISKAEEWSNCVSPVGLTPVDLMVMADLRHLGDGFGCSDLEGHRCFELWELDRGSQAYVDLTDHCLKWLWDVGQHVEERGMRWIEMGMASPMPQESADDTATRLWGGLGEGVSALTQDQRVEVATEAYRRLATPESLLGRVMDGLLDVMMRSIIDWYFDQVLEGDCADVPEEFIREDFRMTVEARYDEVVSDGLKGGH